MTVADYTSAALIIPQLRNREPSAVIGELCSTLHRNGRVRDPFPLFNAAISHETLSSTATPDGWALPHARLGDVASLSFALGRTLKPMPWVGSSKCSVQLIFLCAVPESDGATYMSLISGVARLSKNENLKRALLEAPDGQALFELLKQAALPGPRG